MSVDDGGPAAGPPGLYVHVPFCSVKCFYCDFTAFSGQRSGVGRYLAALRREAESCSRRRAGTLYVGGGTPSELSADELGELFRIVEAVFGPIRALAESTVEANPESLDARRLEVLARFGIGRVSLGLQTAEPRLLREIGRRHGVERFFEVYRLARSLGFALNVDLMTGLPGQSLDDAMRSLETVLGLGPEHLSVYGLSVEDRTLYAKRGFRVDEALDRGMIERSIDRIVSAGYRHYEISNFARPGHESAHNRIYWENGEYIGLGCGASGHLDGVRYSNLDRLEEYCSAVERGAPAVAREERLEGRRRLGETALLRLRLMEGFQPSASMLEAFAVEWDRLTRQGWIERSGARVRLTREGMLLANRVFQEFVAPFRGEKSPAV